MSDATSTPGPGYAGIRLPRPAAADDHDPEFEADMDRWGVDEPPAAVPLTLRVKLLHPAAVPPRRSYPSDAGFDLTAPESFTLDPGVPAVVPLGFAAALPPGWAALIVGRSGLGSIGVDVLGGLIDQKFAGIWKVILVVHGDKAMWFPAGSRIAQALLIPVPEVVVQECDELPETERGDGGFGSTGGMP